MSPAKTAEAIEMPFRLRIQIGPRNHVLVGVCVPTCEGAIFRGKGRPVVKYRDTVVICAKTAEPIQVRFGLWTWVGPRKHVLDGAQIPHVEGQLLEERTCPGMPNDTLP